MKIRFYTIFYLLLSSLAFMPLELYGNGQRDSIPQSAYLNGFPYPNALGVHMGSTGVGLHFYQPIGPQFGFRFGASYMPFNSNITGTYNNLLTRSDAQAKSGNVSVAFGWNPFYLKSGFFRSFNIQAGAAYFYKLDGLLTTRLKDPYRFGDIQVNPIHMGTISTQVDWKKSLSPYAGIGWSNIIIDSRFSMNLDLGCYFLSRPTVRMEATGLLERNVNNTSNIENNIRNYRYLPRVEFGFSYRFW